MSKRLLLRCSVKTPSYAYVIQAMVADKRLLTHLIDKDNPWIKLTFKIWHQVCKNNKLTKAVAMLRWCAYDKEFVPNRHDKRFHEWAEKGRTSYFTFTHNGQ